MKDFKNQDQRNVDFKTLSSESLQIEVRSLSLRNLLNTDHVPWYFQNVCFHRLSIRRLCFSASFENAVLNFLIASPYIIGFAVADNVPTQKAQT